MGTPASRTCEICGIPLYVETEADYLRHVNTCRMQGNYSPNLSSFVFENSPEDFAFLDNFEGNNPKTPQCNYNDDEIIDIPSNSDDCANVNCVPITNKEKIDVHNDNSDHNTDCKPKLENSGDEDKIEPAPDITNTQINSQVVNMNSTTPLNETPKSPHINNTSKTSENTCENVNLYNLKTPGTQELASAFLSRYNYSNDDDINGEKQPQNKEIEQEYTNDRSVNPFVAQDVAFKLRSPLKIPTKQLDNNDSREMTKNSQYEMFNNNTDNLSNVNKNANVNDAKIYGSTDYFDELLHNLRKALLFYVNEYYNLLDKRTITSFEKNVANLMAEARSIRQQIVNKTVKQARIVRPEGKSLEKKDNNNNDNNNNNVLTRQEEEKENDDDRILGDISNFSPNEYRSTQTTLSPFINSRNQNTVRKRNKDSLITNISKRYTEIISTPERIKAKIDEAKKVKVSSRVHRNSKFELYSTPQLKKAMREFNLRYSGRVDAIKKLKRKYETEGLLPNVELPKSFDFSDDVRQNAKEKIIECLVMSPFYHNIVTFIPINIHVVKKYLMEKAKEFSIPKPFLTLMELEDLFINEGVEFFNPSDKDEIMRQENNNNKEDGDLSEGDSDAEERQEPPSRTQIEKKMRQNISILCTDDKGLKKKPSQTEGANILEFYK